MGHLLEWVLEAQANKWSQRTSTLQMDAQPEVKGKNDIGRPSFSEQGPYFIFQSSFYTLSYVQRIMGEGVESCSKPGFLPANLSYAKV